jgi:uncharacterized Zn finger protein
MNIKIHCNECDKETIHSEECIEAPASDPNGDSTYIITCTECGHSETTM